MLLTSSEREVPANSGASSMRIGFFHVVLTLARAAARHDLATGAGHDAWHARLTL